MKIPPIRLCKALKMGKQICKTCVGTLLQPPPPFFFLGVKLDFPPPLSPPSPPVLHTPLPVINDQSLKLTKEAEGHTLYCRALFLGPCFTLGGPPR